MPVDKTGGDHVALGVDGLVAGDLVGGDRRNLRALDANIANSIEIGLRVHDPTVQDSNIAIGSLRDPAGSKQGGSENCGLERHFGRHLVLALWSSAPHNWI